MAIARSHTESTVPLETTVNDAEVRLRKAAISLFAEKGYSDASVREIIERAGVTRPVLYYYFENKEDLFSKLVEAEFAEACSEMDRILMTVSGCRDRLTALILRSFERARKSPDTVRMLVQFFFSPPIAGLHLDRELLGIERFSRIVRVIQEGIDSGELAGEDAEFLALAFAGLMDMHVLAAVGNPEIALTESKGLQLVDLFLGGAANNVRSQTINGSESTS